MEIYNVANISQAIREYALYKMKENYPLLDTTENSPINDILINPLVSMLEPLIKEITDLEFKQNLNNAEHMTKEELDDIGVGNYFIERNQGTKAIGEAVLFFDSSIGNTGIIIPQGVILSNADKTLNFKISRESNLDKDELFIYYNSLSYLYEIPIAIEAESVGSQYNVGEGKIVNIDKFSSALKYVSNNSMLENGSDEESNINYANRLKQFYVSRQLGTEPGYKQFALENYPEIVDVFIVGKDHPMMERDLLTIQRDDLSTYTDHLGGKVDLYIRGSNIEVMTISAISKSCVFKIIDQNIDISSIICTNNGVPITYAVSSANSEYVIVLAEKIDYVDYLTQWVNGDTITFSYSITGKPEVTKTVSGIVDNVDIALKSPFSGVISIKNVTRNIECDLFQNPSYSILYLNNTEVFAKTSKEERSIRLKNSPDDFSADMPESKLMFNGDNISISYSYNKTINNLNDMYNIVGNRIITTDIMIAEANSVYINIGMNIKLKDDQILDATKLGAIRNCISNYIAKVELGKTVEESDIVGELYMDSSVSGFLQYIQLPFTTFYKNESADANFEPGRRDDTFINLSTIEYPLLNFSDIKEIS